MNANVTNGIFYQRKISDDSFEPGATIDEIYVKERGIAFNSLGGVYNTHKGRHKGATQEVSLPEELVEKIDRLAKLKIELQQAEQELTPVIKNFFATNRINAVNYELLGHITGFFNNDRLLVIEDSKDWEKAVESFQLAESTPKIDFSKKKVIIITNEISSNQWLVVRRIRKTVENALEIECGVVSTFTNDGTQGKRQNSQFVLLDKEIKYSEIKITPLNVQTIVPFDSKLKELNEQMDLHERGQNKFGYPLAEKRGWDFLNKLEKEDPAELKKQFNDKEWKQVSSYLESVTKAREVQKLFNARLAEITDKIRGPNLGQIKK